MNLSYVLRTSTIHSHFVMSSTSQTFSNSPAACFEDLRYSVALRPIKFQSRSSCHIISRTPLPTSSRKVAFPFILQSLNYLRFQVLHYSTATLLFICGIVFWILQPVSSPLFIYFPNPFYSIVVRYYFHFCMTISYFFIIFTIMFTSLVYFFIILASPLFLNHASSSAFVVLLFPYPVGYCSFVRYHVLFI
jgi:hypothetical protein